MICTVQHEIELCNTFFVVSSIFQRLGTSALEILSASQDLGSAENYLKSKAEAINRVKRRDWWSNSPEIQLKAPLKARSLS